MILNDFLMYVSGNPGRGAFQQVSWGRDFRGVFEGSQRRGLSGFRGFSGGLKVVTGDFIDVFEGYH